MDPEEKSPLKEETDGNVTDKIVPMEDLAGKYFKLWDACGEPVYFLGAAGKEEPDSKQKKVPFLWQSGCLKFDPRFTTFACQFIISLVVLILCVVQLIDSDSCETQSFYGSILSTIIGIWMPSPLSK